MLSDVAPSVLCMCGIATLAIVVSSTCSSEAAMIPTSNSAGLRTWSCASSAGGAPGRAGRAAEANLRPGLALAAVGEDGHLGREAGDELARAVVVDFDAHRHPLGHLDPVAGRVLRGEDGEFRSGAGADRRDMTFQHEIG